MAGSIPSELVLVANTRMPSKRAQALQVAQVAGAFARAGVQTTLLHAKRSHTTALPEGTTLWDYYGVSRGAEEHSRLLSVAVRNLDTIDYFPRALQYLPARVQEWSFYRAAARRVLERYRGAVVLSREVETARALLRAGVSRVFLEVHRVPGSRVRRSWLVDTARSSLGVLAISGGVREDLLEMGIPPDRVRVEHDGFEPGRFSPRPRREEARQQLGLPVDKPIAVYTGGLLEWKGVEHAVDAARLLPEVLFVIAGGMDADVARIRARARGLNNVRVDGFQPPTLVPSYMAAADVGLVPNCSTPDISSRYTSPLKVFESLACELPLVVSDLPSLRDILQHGESALLVEPEDPSAIAAGIRRILEDEILRARLVRGGLEVADLHDWDSRAGRILAWMGELA
jgi:glycosyltransferase involved in cell wall biosynthesis